LFREAASKTTEQIPDQLFDDGHLSGHWASSQIMKCANKIPFYSYWKIVLLYTNDKWLCFTFNLKLKSFSNICGNI
jgi:hypothetical protein